MQALKALHKGINDRFQATPELLVQMFMPAKLGLSGARVSGSKAEDIYHLVDGEVGHNTAEVKPIASLLRQAVTALGLDTKRTNSALLALRQEAGIDVYIVAATPGELELGETARIDVRTAREFFKGGKRASDLGRRLAILRRRRRL